MNVAPKIVILDFLRTDFVPGEFVKYKPTNQIGIVARQIFGRQYSGCIWRKVILAGDYWTMATANTSELKFSYVSDDIGEFETVSTISTNTKIALRMAYENYQKKRLQRIVRPKWLTIRIEESSKRLMFEDRSSSGLAWNYLPIFIKQAEEEYDFYFSNWDIFLVDIFGRNQVHWNGHIAK